MAIEFELKYRANPQQQEAIRLAFPGEYRVIPMVTTYYDTPDKTLSRRRWTLRHRQEGENQVCTLKVPADRGARGEFEVLCPDILTAIPKLAELSGIEELLTLTAQGVNAVCGVRFTRLAKLVEAEDFTAELALDAGAFVNGDRTQEFAEVELELKSGSRDALLAFSQEFSSKFALEAESKSKYARARALGQEA